MDLQKVKQQLDKLNSYYNYLEANKDSISRLDKDTFLATIRGLYDACFDEAAAPKKVKSTKQTSTTTKTTVRKKKPKVVFTSSNNNQEEEDTEKEETVEADHTTKKVAQKTEEDSPSKKQEVKQEEANDNTENKKQEQAPNSKNKDKQNETVDATTFNEEFEELFVFKAATDLSQKLSASPLKDLNKALGLNEKFLYINELFGGDVSKFQHSIKILNKGDDFEDARKHMENELIAANEWLKNKERKQIAKDFVKLVHRRYL